MFAKGQGPICLGLLCEGINKGFQGVFRTLGPYISAVGSNLQDKDKGPMGHITLQSMMNAKLSLV